jgi:hypothetical protein
MADYTLDSAPGSYAVSGSVLSPYRTFLVTIVLGGGIVKIVDILNIYPSPPDPNPLSNITYFVQGYDSNHIKRLPPLGAGLVSGHVQNIYFWPDKALGAGFVHGNPIIGLLYVAGVTRGAGLIKGDPFKTPATSNVIRTSHIGSFDFTHDDTGEVVRIVMPWSGWIYALKKLGTSGVVAYGENGVTQLLPHGVAWGRKELLKIGIKGKGAVCTRENDREHFFIDKTGVYWRLREGAEPKGHDYSNYFNDLSVDVVMSYDYSDNIIYICDGTLGFVWSESGLGQGPVNITGVGVTSGTVYVAGTGAIVTDPFNICTDIQDFGSRTEKIIDRIDLGVALTNPVYGAIDYRWDTGGAFFTTPWIKADRYGRIHVKATGIEFRILIKLTAWEQIQLDYGNIHVKFDDSKPLIGAPPKDDLATDTG